MASIAATHTHPSAGVSADQLEAGYPGNLPTTGGCQQQSDTGTVIFG
jgi:hypothetical protein